MNIKLAEIIDMEDIIKIINQAKEYLKSQKINQWQTDYPDYECIKNDTVNKKGYIFLNDSGECMAYTCIDLDGEVAYENIQGKWLTKDKYAIVHRLAVNKKYRGKGFSGEIFRLIEEVVKNNHVYSIKIDTDTDNIIMKKILKKLNFIYCGKIIFEGSEKEAFEKIIKK